MRERPPATVIYTHGGGRLGNQVLRFAHWLAWAMEQGGAAEVRDLAFWPYAHHFATWRAHPGCVFPLRADGWAGLARGLQFLPAGVRHRLDWRVQHAVQARGARRPGWQAVALDVAAGETLDLGDPAFARRVAAAATTTCAGWRITGWDALARHQEAVRALLQPAREHAARAATLMAGLRQRHGFVIGVHLRQGDYRTWHDGRFLFSPAQYREWIRQALDLHAAQHPAVVLVADEPVDSIAASDRLVVRPGHGNAMDDWAALALCDVILCPPSTFPATAAFAGNRPLWPVVRAGQVLDRAQILADGLLGAARHPEFSLAVR
jgi:hypothetical protein